MSRLLERYVELHNRGVRTGDFSGAASLFEPTGRLVFRGVPVGPFVGRDVIARAFSERPPSDELRILDVIEREGRADALYGWTGASGVAGSLRVRPASAGIAALEISVFQLRTALPADLGALTTLYNHYVEHTHVTFDTRPYEVAERAAWFEGFAPSGPYRLIVAELGGHAVGYAASTRHRAKPAYRTSVETSVYVAPAHVGFGIGRALYRQLLDQLTAEPDTHRAYAGIALPNPASLQLHERLGFRFIGTFREVGFKFGRYWDVSWWERDVGRRP